MAYFSFRSCFEILTISNEEKLQLLDVLSRILGINLMYEDGIPVGTQNSRGIDAMVGSINGAIIVASNNFWEMNTEFESNVIKQALRHMLSSNRYEIDLNHPLLPMIRVYKPYINPIEQLEELTSLNNEVSEMPQQ